MSCTFPLLASQREVWLGQQIDPTSSVYNLGLYVALPGDLSRSSLEAALNRALSETDALHARFVEESGTPFQVLDRSGDWSVSEVDTSGAADPEAEALAWMRAEVATPIDLSTFPTFASALIRIGADRTWWYQRFHHITLDAAACMGFAARVMELLGRSGETGTVAGDNDDSSIRLLLEAEEEYKDSADFRADESYWKAHARGRYPRTALGAAPPAPPAQFPQRRSVELSSEVRAALIDVCNKAGVLWPAVAFATVAAYLHLYDGATDITLSVPVRARTSPRTNTVPGMTVNILPLRLRVHGGMTLNTLIPRVTAELDNLLLHQRYRGEDLRRHIRGQGSDTRLFGPTVNAVTADAGAEHSMPTFLCGGPVEEFQFQFIGGLDCQQLGIDLLANPAIYSPEALATHADQFCSLLEQLTRQPDRRLGQATDLVPVTSQQDLGCPAPSRNEDSTASTGAAGVAESSLPPGDFGYSESPGTRGSSLSREAAMERLTEIWQRILEIDGIKPDEHFFDLGGHSLLAMDVIAAVEDEFQVKVSVRQFFACPTVRELANIVLDSAVDGDIGDMGGWGDSILDVVADLSDAEAATLLNRLRTGGSTPGEVDA
ncbi:condensation domain-containing protein [Streptomyces ossamyceticus]|nr:condensation domain-containing protein [Streptomyces ossamyceticus]